MDIEYSSSSSEHDNVRRFRGLQLSAANGSHHPVSDNPCWVSLPEGVLLIIAKHLRPDSISKARLACKHWQHVFSLLASTARIDLKEGAAEQSREFLKAFRAAFPSLTELVIEVSFKKVPRERIQAAVESHLLCLKDFGLKSLQFNLDLNSFNERKIKLPDLTPLSQWTKLTSLTVQESGWRSQQLRVDASSVFSTIPSLRTLTIICKYSDSVKARWFRSGRGISTDHLRCQLTQNQSIHAELQKALRKQDPSHITALTFEVVEETYAEPVVASGSVDLSNLPSLKSFVLLSGAEDALNDSKLELLGATGLQKLVIYDVSTGRWCHIKPGHGIPSRLFDPNLASLRTLVLVGFVLNQTPDLHLLTKLTCLEELRIEQPETDNPASTTGDLPLHFLPPTLTNLFLHSVVLPNLTQPAQLSRLQQLYVSRCKVATFQVFGALPHLANLGVLNCSSTAGLQLLVASCTCLTSLALIHTLQPELAPATASTSTSTHASATAASAAAMPGGCSSDEQLAVAAACRHLRTLQLIAPYGNTGLPGLRVLAAMKGLRELDLNLPCMLSEALLVLAELRDLLRFTLWVTSGTCLNRTRARQLQALQRNLQAHMPNTWVDWAQAESKSGSWTGLEAQVFHPF